jgi:hypothetical protein
MIILTLEDYLNAMTAQTDPPTTSSSQPELYLDFDFGNGNQQRVAVFAEDQPEVIAENLSKLYGITSREKTEQLAFLIKKERLNSLAKIEEEDLGSQVD